MFYREVIDKIKKLLTKNKPIMLLGARQVGKTTVVKNIGKNWKNGNYLYINLESNVEFKAIVEESNLNFDEIFNKYKMISGESINSNTLIIFDEIQFCNKLLTGLKYFYESGVENKFIATGSSLGVAINKQEAWSFPIGKIEILEMYPMCFNEFLYAVNQKDFVEYIKTIDIDNKISDVIHNKLLEYFDIYISLGGMPEVINEYVSNNDFIQAMNAKEQIIKGYGNDIIKYAEPKISSKIYEIYNHIDVMLSSDNQKFKITKVNSNTYKELEFPLSWLINSKIVQRCDIIENANLPLRAHIKENNFKLYLSDVGLLMSKANYVINSALLSNDKIYFGVVIENYIANVLTKKNYGLFCYKKRTSEIDFIIQKNNEIIPIEVKSGNNTKAKSLKLFIENNNSNIAYKFSRNNISKNGVVFNLPLYLIEYVL